MRALMRSALPTIAGLVLLSLFIWFAGPLFAFAGYSPLAPVTVRLVVIVFVWVAWAGWIAWKRLRARLATAALATAVVQQSRAEAQPSGDVVALREGFEQAVGALTDRKRGGRGLYELPWYVIVGAPGSGKSTVLVNSGLHFPLEQRTGRNALRGIGGTRNCDWWFTDEAVFLDTAGRYMTQDSDAAADGEAWKAFLGLLRKHRRRQPINGIILTISAQDLMMQTPGAPDPHVEATRRRLVELNRELRIQVPVYVLVTKSDLIAGFTEYFDDLPQEGRAQAWGVTFPIEQTRRGEAAAGFAQELDALVERLNARVFARVEDERDPRRRARVFAFPQQVAALRGALAHYVTEVFSVTRFDHPVLLRGVYFTSGTQEGTPIDRLIGSLSRRFAIAPDAVPSAQPGRGKAYFITRVLHEVMFAESGLAGVNRRFEMQWAAAQVGAYVAIAAVLVLACVLWTVSYGRNRNYLNEVARDVAALEQVPVVAPDASIEAALPRLRAVRAVVTSASRYADDTPWSMSFGLFQGDSLSEAARAAYARELRGPMLWQLAARFRQRLIENAAEPERLYEYLKGYLMLGNPEHLDPKQLEYLAGFEWEQAYANDPDRVAEMLDHFRSLIAFSEKFPATSIDNAVVEQARASLRGASLPGLVYRYIRINYANDTGRALRLDTALGLNADRVLRRRSRDLAEPVSSIYTKPVFQEITTIGTTKLVAQFAAESWVWGSDRPAVTEALALQGDVLQLYETDYINAWDTLINDIQGVPLTSLGATKEALALLGGSSSPIRSFLRVVREHTYLVTPDAKPAAPGIVDRVMAGPKSILERGQRAAGVPAAKPGARITAHFAPIHQLLGADGGPGPIDAVIQKLQELSGKLQPIGAAAGNTNPADPAAIASVGQTATDLQREAAPLPSGLGAVVAGAAAGAMTAVRGGVRDSLQSQYQQDVVRECLATTANRYPFVAASTDDVQLADFGALFGYGGVYERFFNQHLAGLVDNARPQWAWKADATGSAVGGSSAVLRQFQLASEIRRAFFPANSQVPQVPFTVNMPMLDNGSARFQLSLDGENYSYAHGRDDPKQMRWPGAPPGRVLVTFEAVNGTRENLVIEGPWALFRLLEQSRIQPESDTAFVYALQKGSRSAELRVTALSMYNPFGKSLLRNFRCG